jgi:hypothetical protein
VAQFERPEDAVNKRQVDRSAAPLWYAHRACCVEGGRNLTSFPGSLKAGAHAGGGSTDSRLDKSSAYRSRHGHPEQQPQESDRRSDVIIEVAPGVQVVLRGSQETWEAIKDDFYMPCQCIGCDTSLFVIQDAAYVLCPQCYSIVPLDGEFIDRAVSGVGMGFVIEDLMQWQQEILRDRL